MAVVGDGRFNPQPTTPSDAPDQKKAAGACSRLIDITYNENVGYYYISCVPYKLEKAQDLESSLNLALFSVTHPPQTGTATRGEKPLDRTYYENNWPFARSLLCRTFVQGVFDNTNPSNLAELPEDEALARFQMFLQSAHLREPLSFSYSGLGTTSDLGIVQGNNRLLCHFGFDWVAVPLSKWNAAGKPTFKTLNCGDGTKYVVRRRTCLANVLKMKSTEKFAKKENSSLCPSWASQTTLIHRRTLILFNELHAEGDNLPISRWLTDQSLWAVSNSWNTTEDDEGTAIIYIYRLVCQVWEMVVREWKNVIDQCSEHIKTSEIRALEVHLTVHDLENLAREMWRDCLDWTTLGQLLRAQKKTIVKAKDYLSELSTNSGLFSEARPESQSQSFGPDAEIARLNKIIDEFTEMDQVLSQDFPSRGKDISDVIYNIIGVRTAAASEDYSKQMGDISWITFIFFPLITCSGIFGMNVDVFANSPSIKWYFVLSIPLTLLVLVTAYLIHNRRLVLLMWSRLKHKHKTRDAENQSRDTRRSSKLEYSGKTGVVQSNGGAILANG